MRRMIVRCESWPLREPFRISRLEAYTAEAVIVEITQGDHVGRGECERPEAFEPHLPDTCAAIESARSLIEAGGSRADLACALPAGPARSALDVALWDIEAKLSRRPVWELAGVVAPQPLTSAFTLSLDTPGRMAEAARRAIARPLLKLKLGGPGDLERVVAVRGAAPKARLIADANEAWSVDQLRRDLPRLAELGVELLEQPLPAGQDGALLEIQRAVPVCADESCHDRSTLGGLAGAYDFINVKLDKTGGLTEALALIEAARARGFRIMVGSMVGTSLAMAPATLLANSAEYVDLDGPLLLERDRTDGLPIHGSTLHPPPTALWGHSGRG